MNNNDGGNAAIPKNENIHNQPVVLSSFKIPETDLIFFVLYISKTLPEVKKNDALINE